jgi:Zn-dependent M28 family amino/carboxypeptidase
VGVVWHGIQRTAAVLTAIVTSVAIAGCSHETSAPPATSSLAPVAAPNAADSSADSFAGAFLGETLRQRVSVDAMMGHLHKLQEIADANGGIRSLGTPGYQASADYVAGVLRDKGFDVQDTDFELRLPFADDPTVTVGGQAVKAKPLKFTVGTPPDGVSGPLVVARADDSPGCAESDYDGMPVKDAVVLVDRGACPFGQKEKAAAARGALGVIVANNVEGIEAGGTLGEDTKVTIPVVGISMADGARLRANPAPTNIKLKAGVRVEHTHNVIAQTKTGSTHDVVMTGAHLDSVPEGPGINDNGSGVAAILETAVQLGSSPPVKNAVRFAFWGAEETGLLGSKEYIGTLDVEALKDVALYLNFDMLGSPNPGYLTYDGDQSAPPSPNGPPRVPEGSAGIERTFVAYLKAAGKQAEDTDFDGRSDYDAFTRAGIPSGGLFSGAEEKKTEAQAKLWGGEANLPFDPNYHQKTDTVDQVDRTALDIHGRGVAYAIGLYAQDESGRNGVPVRGDRTRHTVSAS